MIIRKVSWKLEIENYRFFGCMFIVDRVFVIVFIIIVER